MASATNGKTPRTERGRKTLRKLLDAATHEFGQKGFHEASISGITSRAGVALGTFYTYFESKEAIFHALVSDLSEAVRIEASDALKPGLDALTLERDALAAFLRFARAHKEIYRIIDEAEFVDPASYRRHYESTAERILARLRAGIDAGSVAPDIGEAEAWAVMGMNVFLGLRYAVWSRGDENLEDVASVANRILTRGIAR